MRWLIDGYNVMHAAGLISPAQGREGFRRARRRFLDELARVLPTDLGDEATVVFDANVPPGDFPVISTYRGIRVIFALEDDDADSRIEQILEHDSNPRHLTVVSTDRRIRQAAARRRARPLTADAFLYEKDDLRKASHPPTQPGPESEPGHDVEPDPDETGFWVEVFRGVDDLPGVRDVHSPSSPLLTDAEIAEIQRLIDREG